MHILEICEESMITALQENLTTTWLS